MKNIEIRSDLRNNYTDYYKDGDSEWRRIGAIDKSNNIKFLCDNVPHRTVIEIGAGDGSILKKLSELNFTEKLYALEISSSGVETIKNKKISSLVECNLYDGYNTTYDDHTFDLAILSHVIEHVEYPRKLLYEAARIAKYIFIEVPLEDTIMLPQNFKFDKVGHINCYSYKTIRRLIQSCNINLMHQIITNPSKLIYTYQKGKTGLLKYYLKESILKISPIFATRIFSYNSAIICKKN